jgi:hypothetical protein
VLTVKAGGSERRTVTIESWGMILPSVVPSRGRLSCVGSMAM